MDRRNQTSAYDLSAFEKKESAVSKPNLQVIKGRKSNKNAASPVNISAIMFGILLVLMVAGLLYSNAKINELGNEINKANKEYTTLVGENKKLTAILESKVSLKNVESYAKEKLGLAKMESYQIEYINLLPEDKIQYIDDVKEEKITEKILKSVNKFISGSDEEGQNKDKDKDDEVKLKKEKDTDENEDKTSKEE